MKTMTKIIAGAFTALAIFIGTNVKAQTTPANTLRFGVGLEVGAPTGNAHDISNFELGGTARLQYGVSHDLALTLTSGYYNFFGKTVTSREVTPGGVTTVTFKGRSLGMIPVKAGIKAFISNGFYFSAEAGAGFEVHPIIAGGEKDTKLILSPGLGYASKSWDVGVRYENYSGQGNNYGLVGLRLAYGFGL
ncbi:hypothetical protein [Mucilaginibacter sp. SP1R1]|uniref:hypothetical protein n=1 Tax=Mucilaginibacter sp. SP1R1 TaxID=2723091 RepID=UPI0016201B82|nr:hypothetical protein [Mucilaginibacter sp. SP1R1]MBB6148248.1 hypothetical protein [Mucilaginibacter sp. SP1R1]